MNFRYAARDFLWRVRFRNLNAPSADDRLRRVDREVKAFGRPRPCSRFAPLPTPPAAPLLERSRDPGPGAVFGRFAPGEFSLPSGCKCAFMNELDIHEDADFRVLFESRDQQPTDVEDLIRCQVDNCVSPELSLTICSFVKCIQ